MQHLPAGQRCSTPHRARFCEAELGVPSTDTHKPPPKCFPQTLQLLEGAGAPEKEQRATLPALGKVRKVCKHQLNLQRKKSGASIWRQHRALVPHGWHRPKGRHTVASPETCTVQGRRTDPAAALRQILNTCQSPQHRKSAPC